MKLWSATPALLSRRTLRTTVIGFAVVMTAVTPLTMVAQVQADRYDDQMNSLQAQASQYQSQANDLRAKADTLQNKLDQITAQKGALESQIAINNAKHDKLMADIAANQIKLDNTQNALGDMLANLYVDDKISALEMLASAENIGDYVDKQEYRTSVRDELSNTIDTVKQLKAQMEKDKAELEKVMTEMDAQNKQLAAVQAQQQQLVDQTRGEEAAYQQLVNSARSQMADVAAQQRAYYQSLLSRGGGGSGVVGSFQYSNWSGNQGCGGGYPYCAPQDSMVDAWGLYNRECVSYVAWALSARFGKYVGNFSGQGNAYEWPSSAPAYSGAVRVASPQPGDVVVLPASGSFAPVGHVMIVESVSGDTMRVSQYNFYGTGQFSTMDVKNSGVILLRFHNR